MKISFPARLVRAVVLSVIALIVALVLPASPAAAEDGVSVGPAVVRDVQLNGEPGSTILVQPGEAVSITATTTDYDTGCPGCIVFVDVAYAGAPTQAGCLYGAYPAERGTQTATVDLGPAPLEPGAYPVLAQYQQVYYCGQYYSPDGGSAIATVIVAPQQKADCKKQGYQAFGGIFKNQGDCVSFVATGGRNAPAGL